MRLLQILQLLAQVCFSSGLRWRSLSHQLLLQQVCPHGLVGSELGHLLAQRLVGGLLIRQLLLRCRGTLGRSPREPLFLLLSSLSICATVAADEFFPLLRQR